MNETHDMPIARPTGFDELHHRLQRLHLESQLPGKATAIEAPLEVGEIVRLLSWASILGLSEEPTDRSAAYDVATRLVELQREQDSEIISAADLILSRIGNFPGRGLLRDRYCNPKAEAVGSHEPRIPLRLHLERLAREAENTVDTGEDREVTLTDFQFKLMDVLGRHRSVSVSAPTSAGKSFIMGLDLVRRLRKNPGNCIVYVVPTRALIREVSLGVRRQLSRSGLSSIPIRTVAFPIERSKAPNGIVFVLTQERLMSLLHSTRGKQWIDTVVVDEAQNVGDDARGVLLQSSVEAVMIRFPEADIHFASPLSSNPEFLLKLFKLDRECVPFVEEVSPVAQSVILVTPVDGKPKQGDFAVVLPGGSIMPMGRRMLPFRLRDGVFDQRAALARSVTRDDEATILYANRADYTEELAGALIAGQTLPAKEDIDPEIHELIEFLRTEIHAEYPLIEVLPHRVGFHYGHMPAIVRSRIEDLFKNGKLKFVCCTSTLLQGVNLPARHILLENPKAGRFPLSRGAFLNLAGRAGRLLHEFHGTIWCFRPGEWDETSYTGSSLHPMEAAFPKAMADGGTIIQRILSETASPEEIDLGEATLGKVYCDIVRGGKVLVDEFGTENNAATLAATANVLASLNISLPTEILDANRSVRPDRLQALYEFLRAQNDLTAYVPLGPGQSDSLTRMGEIIQLIERFLRNVDNQSHQFYRWLATQWIFNTPLNRIIAARIGYRRSKGDQRAASVIIRELLSTLELEIRFRLVKHYMAYISILGHIYRERNNEAAAEALQPFHVFLECGAIDSVALSLMALGLSRVTALALRDGVRFPEDASPEDCLAQLAVTNLKHRNIPILCIREIDELLAGYLATGVREPQ